jgi:hypothetical protein
MRHKVLVVGAGQLGSRYLQGLAKVSMPLDIWVSDVAPESLARAKVRWMEAEGDKTQHQVSFANGLAGLPEAVDLAIVATAADVRLKLVTEVASTVDVDYWVLEKVLAQNSQDVTQIESVLSHATGSWVNTPRHMWTLYQQLRAQYRSAKPIHARFEGCYGLACNAIHYIDFVSRWSNSRPIAIETDGLSNQWHAAKRMNFMEVWGRLSVTFDDGSQLDLVSESEKHEYKVSLKIDCDEWTVSELEGFASRNDGYRVHGACEPQSQLTQGLTESILQTGRCDLPTLNDAAIQHRLLLDGLLAHWNSKMPNELIRLPIT